MHNLPPTCVHNFWQNNQCAAKITDQSIVDRRLCSAGEKLIEQPFEGNDRTDGKDCGRKKRKRRKKQIVSLDYFQELLLAKTSPTSKTTSDPALHCIALRFAFHKVLLSYIGPSTKLHSAEK